MAHSVQRDFTLTDELATVVDAAVASGEFASDSEVVAEALRQWNERRDNFGYSRDELRALIQEGIDSGPSKPGAPILQKLRKKLAAMAEQVADVA